MLPTAGVPFLTHLLARIAAAGHRARRARHVVQGGDLRRALRRRFRLGPANRVRHRDRAARHRRRHPQRRARLRGRRPSMVFNGDVLSGLDLGAVLDTHAATGRRRHAAPDPGRGPARVRLCAARRRRPGAGVPGEDAGPADRPDQRRLLRLPPRVIETIPPGRPVSVERETFPGLLAAGARIFGYVDAAYWLDIGTPEDFVRGSRRSRARHRDVPGAARAARGPLVQPAPGRAECHGDRRLRRRRGAEVGAGARRTARAVRRRAGGGRRGRERSIVGFGARIGPRALVRDGVIGDGADIGARYELLAGLGSGPVSRFPTAASASPPTFDPRPPTGLGGRSTPSDQLDQAGDAVAFCVDGNASTATSAGRATRRRTRPSAPSAATTRNRRSRWRVGTPSEQVIGCVCAESRTGRCAGRRCRTPRAPPAARHRRWFRRFLTVPAELHPASQPRLQGQHVVAAVSSSSSAEAVMWPGHMLAAGTRAAPTRGTRATSAEASLVDVGGGHASSTPSRRCVSALSAPPVRSLGRQPAQRGERARGWTAASEATGDERLAIVRRAGSRSRPRRAAASRPAGRVRRATTSAAKIVEPIQQLPIPRWPARPAGPVPPRRPRP